MEKVPSAIEKILAVILVFSAGRAAGRDWKEIKESGFLICAVNAARDGDESCVLSRRATPEDCEQGLLNNFAATNGIKIFFREERTFAKLFDHLRAGRCDMVAAALTATPEREREFRLTHPFGHSFEQIVVSSARRDITNLEDICAHKLKGAILPGTSYLATLKSLSGNYSLKYKELPKTIPQEDLLDSVSSGKIGFTMLDNGFIDSYLTYSPTVKVVYRAPESQDLVWALPQAAPELQARLNRFLGDILTCKEYQNQLGDWNSISRRGILRMITSNTAYCYYLKKGTIQGFEYELAKRFADENHLHLVVVVPPSFADMEFWLRAGKGDFIAASFTRTAERESTMKGVRFCVPYAGATQVMVGRSKEKMKTEDTLNGRKVYVREGTSYFDSLKKMREAGDNLTLVALPPGMDEFDKFARVESGEYDLTVTDDVILNLALEGRMKLKSLFPVSGHEPYSWLVRENNPVLAEKINAFFQKNNKSVFYNLLYKKYYVLETRKAEPTYLDLRRSRISQYDTYFQRYAGRYGLDWRLIASQSYQESRFNPDARSPFGAIGLMQMLPRTANELGFPDINRPDNGIHAGTKYMRAQLDKYDDGKVADLDRICFALASYNAGYGHILDARKIAADSGLDPNRWHGHVETALRKLENPLYASRSRFGYCRATETIPYVDDILLRFHDYRTVLEAALAKKNVLQKSTKSSASSRATRKAAKKR